jgi:dephospho-CoA kinase
MLRVGLTGGIAAGKTMVSDRLAQLGAVIIDADLLAREVVAPGTPGLAAIAERFGEGVISDGALNRSALGAIVFADPMARADLERIIHPAVRARAAEIERQAPTDAVVVHVIPLLVETGQQHSFDLVVVIDVDPETQIQRLRARNAMSVEDAQARVAAQASRDDRLTAGDRVLANDGSADALRPQIDRLWAELLTMSKGR